MKWINGQQQQSGPSSLAKTKSTQVHADADSAALPHGSVRWLVLAMIVSIPLAAAIWLAPFEKNRPLSSVKDPTRETPWKPERWEPRTAEERLIDQFVKLRQAKDKKALDLLGPAPIFDKKPVSEPTASALQTDFFLRADLRIVDIWRGEPDGSGKQREAPRRFTLITKGNVSAPPLSVRTDKGIDAPGQLMMANPDLIVEIRDGKIHGLRAELHMGP